MVKREGEEGKKERGRRGKKRGGETLNPLFLRPE